MITVIFRVQWGGMTCLGLHNKERGKIQASVCSPAWKTYTDIPSNSSAGTGEPRLKPKVKLLPPSHWQYSPQSNPFPNTRPGRESAWRCPGTHSTRGCHSPRSPCAPSLIAVGTRGKARGSSSLGFCNSSRPAQFKPPSSPQHTNAHSHSGQYITALG